MVGNHLVNRNDAKEILPLPVTSENFSEGRNLEKATPSLVYTEINGFTLLKRVLFNKNAIYSMETDHDIYLPFSRTVVRRKG